MMVVVEIQLHKNPSRVVDLQRKGKLDAFGKYRAVRKTDIIGVAVIGQA